MMLMVQRSVNGSSELQGREGYTKKMCIGLLCLTWLSWICFMANGQKQALLVAIHFIWEKEVV